MIPNIFYFILFGKKEFNLFHYVALKSAFEINKPERIVFLCDEEPQSEWFQRCKPFIQIEKIIPPETIFNNTLYHFAHKADVIRLEILINRGGVYMDLDTICLKPLEELRHFECVMGEEYFFWSDSSDEPRQKYYKGLCNAVILAKPNSSFLLRWYDSYKSFRSSGSGHFWAEHSVEIPGRLSKIHNNEIHVLGQDAFFNPSWDEEGLKSLFKDNCTFPDAYVHHLWENVAWSNYLVNLTPSLIKTVDTSYNKLARQYLVDIN